MRIPEMGLLQDRVTSNLHTRISNGRIRAESYVIVYTRQWYNNVKVIVTQFGYHILLPLVCIIKHRMI